METYRVTVLFGFLWYFTSTIQLIAGEDHGPLLLTPLIKNGSIPLARNLSTVNARHFEGVESYSGFLTVQEEYESNLFFWYFPHQKSDKVPWLIWLQGGPGFTSLLGVFDGIGPFKIVDDKVKLNKKAWTTDYSLLFVDNPVGAGYSYTKHEDGYTTNEDEVGEQLLEFLKQFLMIFPELRTAPLFLAGQSYAGKYIPAFGSYIHNWKTESGDNDTLNFKGVAIGNGLIDPRSQLAEGHGRLCEALGLLEGKDLETLREVQQECVDYIDQGKMIDASNKFNESIEFIKKRSGVNIYNFDKQPGNGSVAPLEEYVTSSEVREFIHVGSTRFNFNNQHVYKIMLPDIMNSTKPFLEQLLEHYAVLCYTGQLDVILPYALAKPMYAQFKWTKREEYDKAPRKRLRDADDGHVVAYRKSGGNFVEVLIRNAGHMVAKEQPDVYKFIVDNFIDEYKNSNI